MYTFYAQDGRTALIGAAESGDANCVRLLLDAGADTEAKNNVRMIGSESLGVVMNHVSHLFASLSPEILFIMIHATKSQCHACFATYAFVLRLICACTGTEWQNSIRSCEVLWQARNCAID